MGRKSIAYRISLKMTCVLHHGWPSVEDTGSQGLCTHALCTQELSSRAPVSPGRGDQRPQLFLVKVGSVLLLGMTHGHATRSGSHICCCPPYPDDQGTFTYRRIPNMQGLFLTSSVLCKQMVNNWFWERGLGKLCFVIFTSC